MFDIYVDSAANLPAEEVNRYGIKVASFHTYVNGEMIEDFDPSLSPEEERKLGHNYYEAIRQGANVQTSLVNQAEFLDHFSKTLKEGRDIVYISLSKFISGTYNAAKLASESLLEEFPDRSIHLLDSMNASLGQGLLEVYGSEMREQGLTAGETADKLEQMSHIMNGIFTVDNLNYLAKSGRVHNAKALLGNALSIKPLLKGSSEGVIVQFKNVRGRKKSIKELIDLVCNNIVNPEKQILGIAHADAYEDSLHIMEEIQKRVKVRGFINTSYDYCTGSHVGPGTLALFYIGKDREPK